MQVSPKQSPRGFQGSAGYTPLLQEGTWDTVVGGRSRELNATSIALLQSLLRSLRISHWGLEVQIELTSHYSWLNKNCLLQFCATFSYLGSVPATVVQEQK